jgi:hypothetical protein
MSGQSKGQLCVRHTMATGEYTLHLALFAAAKAQEEQGAIKRMRAQQKTSSKSLPCSGDIWDEKAPNMSVCASCREESHPALVSQR